MAFSPQHARMIMCELALKLHGYRASGWRGSLLELVGFEEHLKEDGEVAPCGCSRRQLYVLASVVFITREMQNTNLSVTSENRL